MKTWIQDYLKEQTHAAESLPVEEIEVWIGLLNAAREKGAQIFACGNGGSAANCSHFAVDLGKGGSGITPPTGAMNRAPTGQDAGTSPPLVRSHEISPRRTRPRPSEAGNIKRFRVLSLNDNIPWITALSNDLKYEDIFVEQLKNYAQSGDILLGVSVSGNSPNVVKAVEWANSAGITTLGLVGNRKENQLARLSNRVIAVDSNHYGRVEDAQMHVLHMLCYAFIEGVAQGATT